MAYVVKEIYFTRQGEGFHTGRPAVFCRFAGCNLWSGREADRSQAICRFCDTDFLDATGPAGGRYPSSEDLALRIAGEWPLHRPDPCVVFTGGEPLLQLDAALVAAVQALGFQAALETNGTRTPPPGLDWVCVSPKAGAELRLTHGDELKLVHPQEEAPPERFAELAFDHFFLQPMDGPNLTRNQLLVEEYCRRNPKWRVSLQTHKLLGLR